MTKAILIADRIAPVLFAAAVITCRVYVFSTAIRARLRRRAA